MLGGFRRPVRLVADAAVRLDDDLVHVDIETIGDLADEQFAGTSAEFNVVDGAGAAADLCAESNAAEPTLMPQRADGCCVWLDCADYWHMDRL